MFTWLTKLRLQTRVSLLVFLGLMLIFAFMAWQGRQIADANTQMVLQERLTVAHVVAQHLDQDLERTLSRLAQVTASPAINLEDSDLEPEKAELRALYRPDYFSYVFLLDKDGLVLWTEPYLPDVVNREHLECPHVQETLRTGEPAIACVAHALTPLSPVIAPVVPIRNPQGTFSRQGAIVGALGAAIDPSSPPFVQIFQGMAPGNTGYIQLVDENGIVLAHTQRQHLFQQSEHSALFISLLKEKKSTIATYTVTEENRGTFSEVIAFAPLTSAPWGVAVEQDEAEFLALSTEASRRMMIFAVIAIAGALLLAWLTTRSVTQPVRKLVIASERVAAGDLATPVPLLGEDEIGELGKHFEKMRARLARWGEELEAAVQKRTRELSTLYTIDRAAAQSLDLDEILNDSLDKVLETQEVEAGGIYLLEPNGETMTLRVHHGLSDEFVANVQHIRLGEGISGRAAAEGKPVVLDVPDYPSERLAPYVVREGFQTLGSTPLLSAGQLVGALNLATRRPRAFPPEELELLTAIGRQLGGAVQNARLYEETRRHLEELTSLQEAAMTVAGELELPRVLDRIVEKAATSLGFPFSAIFLLDAAHDLLHVRAAYGLSERYFRGMEPVPLGVGLVGRAAAERQPVVSGDLANEPRMQVVPHDLQVALEEGIRAVLVVPMLAKGKVVGTLSVYTKTQQAFAPEQMHLLSTFADQAAIATENARLFEAERRRGEQMAALVEMNRAITEGIGLKETLDRIINSARKIIPVSECSVSLVDELNGDMVVQASTNGEIGVRISPTVPSAVGWVAKTKQLLAEEDVSTNPIFNQELNQRYGIQSAMAVPIIYKGKGIGALGLSVCHGRRVFSDSEKMMAQAIADQAAIAIENARLYEETRARAERLSLLNHIARALSTTLNLDELLEVVHREIAAVIESDVFFIALYDCAANELDFRIRVDKGIREPLERRPLTTGLTASIITNKQPILIRDFEKEKEHLPPAKLWGTMQAPPSWLGVPMLRGENVVGVISVQAYRPNAYSKVEQELLSTIADAVAVAMENARLYTQTQQSLTRITILYELSSAILTTTTVEETASVVARQVVRAAGAHSTMLNLIDAEGQCTVRIGMDAQGPLPPEPPPRPDGTTMTIARTGEWLIVTDLAERNAPIIPRLIEMGIKTVIGLPLKVGTRVTGVLFVRYSEPHPFSADEIQALTIYANQAATALEKARLYQGLEESKAALEAKVRELERFTRLAVGRELRMKELKEKMRELEEQGSPSPERSEGTGAEEQEGKEAGQ